MRLFWNLSSVKKVLGAVPENMKYFINKFKTNTLFKTYILIMMPVAVLMITMLVLNILYTSNYRNILERTYVRSLTSMYNENERSIQDAVSGIHMLAHNNEFMESIRAKSMTESQTTYITSLLDSIERGNSLIHSIIILDRGRNGVYTSRGRSRLDTFKYRFNYENYGEDFWMSYRAPLSAVQMLAPTMVNEGGAVSSVLPVVFTQVGEEKLSKLMVVNMDISNILYKMNDLKFTENSRFYIMNKQNGQLFSTSTKESVFAGKELYKKITDEAVCSINHRIKGSGMNMIISLSPTVSELGYSYVVIIPFADINKKLMAFMLVFLCFSVFAVGSAVFMVHRSTQKIGSLFEGIASLFGGENKDEQEDENEGDIVSYISSQIRKTLYANENIESELSIALPMVMEKYLLNLLNQNDYYVDKKMDKMVKNFIKFEYDYFMLIIIKMNPTEKFYEEFTNPEYKKIKEGIYDILKELLCDMYFTYIIPSEENTLYIVLNLRETTAREEIQQKINQIMKMFEIDREYMQFLIGMGNIYPEIAGLKKSYNEAQNNLITGSVVNKKTLDAAAGGSSGLFITISDENSLYNYMISNKMDSARELIRKIIDDCEKSGADKSAMSQLFVQIFNVVFKVMRIQNISYTNANRSDFDVLKEIMLNTPEESYSMLNKLLDKISDILSATHSKVDVMAIISYIDENYKSELSLDILANEFNTSPKYISKLVKDKLGISFVEYVAGLRINCAKELLEKTNKNITEVYTEIGFNNRNTFIRTFKNFMGITPSEYRNIKGGDK